MLKIFNIFSCRNHNVRSMNYDPYNGILFFTHLEEDTVKKGRWKFTKSSLIFPISGSRQWLSFLSVQTGKSHYPAYSHCRQPDVILWAYSPCLHLCLLITQIVWGVGGRIYGCVKYGKMLKENFKKLKKRKNVIIEGV